MRLERVKGLVAAIGGGMALLVVSALLAGGSLAVILTGTGADPRDAFSEASVVPASLAGRVVWQPDADDLPRAVEPRTRVDLEAAWVRAFAHLETAGAASMDQSGLETWFEGPALSSVLAQLQGGDTPRGLVASGHELTVHFYSEDGQIVSLSSQTRVERTVAGSLFSSVDTYEAVVVLSDGNWRIRHLERSATLIGS